MVSVLPRPALPTPCFVPGDGCRPTRRCGRGPARSPPFGATCRPRRGRGSRARTAAASGSRRSRPQSSESGPPAGIRVRRADRCRTRSRASVDAPLAGVCPRRKRTGSAGVCALDVAVAAASRAVRRSTCACSELAAGGDDVDHPRNLPERLREPLVDVGVELLGVDEGARRARASSAAFLQ